MLRKLITLGFIATLSFAQAPVTKVATTDGSGNSLYTTVGDSLLTANTAFGISALRMCHAQYSFAVDGGGAPGLITPTNNCTLPANSTIFLVSLRWTTPAVGLTNTTSVGITGMGGGTAAFVALTAVGSLAGNLPAIVLAGTSSTWVKITTSGTVTFTTAVAALSAGICEVNVLYFTTPT